jgi:hypothetical protein
VLSPEKGRLVADRVGWFRKKKIASQLSWRLSRAKEILLGIQLECEGTLIVAKITEIRPGLTPG